jgi:hypothetical protein
LPLGQLTRAAMANPSMSIERQDYNQGYLPKRVRQEQGRAGRTRWGSRRMRGHCRPGQTQEAMTRTGLNREVSEFERRVRDGTHTPMGDGSVYEPPAVDLETETQADVLGGSGSVPASDESVKERRRRIL